MSQMVLFFGKNCNLFISFAVNLPSKHFFIFLVCMQVAILLTWGRNGLFIENYMGFTNLLVSFLVIMVLITMGIKSKFRVLLEEIDIFL